MAYRDDFKTSSILDFAKEKELRLSVRNGLQEDFMKSVSEFDVNCIDVIVNKVKIICIPILFCPLPILYVLYLFRDIFLKTNRK